MKLTDATLSSPGFGAYLSRAGFVSDAGELTAGPAADRYRGALTLTDAFIEESGGLLRAVSRRAAAVVRRDLAPLTLHTFPDAVLERWQYILLHRHPHLDEYLASYILRAGLPDGMHRLKVDETALFSRTADEAAIATWPHAAVLGVGSVVRGGAEPLLLFDEHTAPGETRENASLVLLMKRCMLGTQQPPHALYELIREVNHIDQYGVRHPKHLSAYAKYLHSVPLPTAGGDAPLTPEWKAALMDACFAAFYLAQSTGQPPFRGKLAWEPFLKLSLADFAARTALASQPGFDAAWKKVQNFLTEAFCYGLARGDLKYAIPHPKNPEKTSTAELIMLVPYLPRLLFHYWGGALAQALLFPLWECRVYKEMLDSRCRKALTKLTRAASGDVEDQPTDVGHVTMLSCRHTIGGQPIRIVDFTPASGLSSPAPVNYFIKTSCGGCGLSIFRSADTHTLVVTRGEKIDEALWERICARLVAEEGESDDEARPGAWHVTRNPLGIAGFLLNGNPTHRYVPMSRITARSLADLVDECLDA